jgi:PilZ domain
MNLFTQLRQEWHSATPQHLLDAPATVLKAVDEPRAQALQEALGVHSVREMATQPLVDWVWRTFSLFRAGVQRDLPEDAAQHVSDEWLGRSCGDWLASPLSSLKELPEDARNRLMDALGWVTVRHMAGDMAFAAAREIARIVTGKPVEPERTVVKPAPEYFAGGTQRFLNRVREAGGQTQKAVAPPPPPPPPAPPPRAPELRTESELAPAVAATLRPAAASQMPHVPQRPHKDYTPDGVYIPRGGGMRGWVDNQGVARIEQANAYHYRDMVDTERFKRSALEAQARTNNRGSDRKDMRVQVRWSADPAVPPAAGLCLNLSLTGAKLRVGRHLPEDTALQVTWVHRDDLLGQETAVMTLSARVVWSQPVNAAFRNPRYDCGVHFDPLELDTQERLTYLLTDAIDKLLEMGEPQPPAAS